MALDPWVTLAHIVRPQGRKGEIIAELWTDFPEKFAQRKRLFLLADDSSSATTPREILLEDFRPMQDRVVLKFAGIDSIEQAESLRGLTVAIPHQERAPLEEDSAYISDLIGCQLYDSSPQPSGQPRLIGVITNVDRAATNTDLLIVELYPEELHPEHAQDAAVPATAPRAEIPFVKAFLDRLDIAARRVEMRLPAGLLEINVPAPRRPERERPPRPWRAKRQKLTPPNPSS
jgi:16S rRNA processing protein RimM